MLDYLLLFYLIKTWTRLVRKKFFDRRVVGTDAKKPFSLMLDIGLFISIRLTFD